MYLLTKHKGINPHQTHAELLQSVRLVPLLWHHSFRVLTSSQARAREVHRGTQHEEDWARKGRRTTSPSSGASDVPQGAGTSHFLNPGAGARDL